MKRNKDDDLYRQNGREEPRGNIFTFFCGIIVFCLGVYLVFQNTVVTTGFSLYRYIGFEPPQGLVFLPLLIGIIMIFFKDKSIVGWILIILGILIIRLGILSGLRIYFKTTSLFEAIMMFGLTAAGIGITLKGLYGKK